MSTAAEPIEEVMHRTWRRQDGVIGWLSQTNHKSIGTRFVVTALVFFLIAGVEALAMRLQLATPLASVLSPETYNQLFTMHGSTMMFLFAIPIVEGIGMYLVPLMIGARDMAFPRLNAFGYWVFLGAGASLYIGFLTGNAPDAGWFNYVPLSRQEFSPGLGIDYWTTAITFLEIAALVAAVELIVTILKFRAPGMSLNRIPLFVWAILVTSFMILFAMPAVMLASVMLAVDRFIGAHFFNTAAGGDPLLWQHLFWIFGHPEVYIILLPQLGMISMIVATFARRPIAAYTLVVVSLVAVGFLSFGLWVHHMFATGLPWLALSFFSAASMLVAIPNGIQVLSWIATIWGSRPKLETPFLYILGFFFVFVLGGITGVMVGSFPFDEQAHDTFFVVAHFHYVIIGGSVFPLFAAIHYWYPKVTGRMLSEPLGKIGFWLFFFGVNLTFFPMHWLGLIGMPRRVYTYQPNLGWDGWNLFTSIAAFVIASGVAVLTFNIVRSYFAGEKAGDNPWGAGTLEWAIPSPPPTYNFAVIPQIDRRFPLWGADQLGPSDPEATRVIKTRGATLEPERRETVGTSIIDATPVSIVILAGPSIWPLFMALSVALIFFGSIVSLWAVPIGAALVYVSALGWLWPRKEEW